MVKVNFTNENGNISVKVRDGLRTQVNEKFLSVMEQAFDGIELNADKQIALPIAEDNLTGATIYAVFSVTLTTKDQTKKTERKKKAKTPATETVEVPDLF